MSFAALQLMTICFVVLNSRSKCDQLEFVHCKMLVAQLVYASYTIVVNRFHINMVVHVSFIARRMIRRQNRSHLLLCVMFLQLAKKQGAFVGSSAQTFHTKRT